MDLDKQKLDELFKTVNYWNGNKIISLPTANGFEFFTLNDIIRCEGDNNYTTFYFTDARKLVISKTLGEYEEMLKPYCFFRVHQSHLINLRHVKSYKKDASAIVLTDNSIVEISRRKKIEFFKLFNF